MTTAISPVKVKSVRCSAGSYELTVQADTFVLTKADPDYPAASGDEWLLEGNEVEQYFTRKRDAIAWLQAEYAKQPTAVRERTYYWHRGKLRECGDCVLRAVEHVTGIGYKLSQQRALEYGFVRGYGMNVCQAACFLEAVEGRQLKRFLGAEALGGMTVSQFAVQYTGKWIIFVKEHAIGLLDGQLDGEFTYEGCTVKLAMGWGEKRQ